MIYFAEKSKSIFLICKYILAIYYSHNEISLFILSQSKFVFRLHFRKYKRKKKAVNITWIQSFNIWLRKTQNSNFECFLLKITEEKTITYCNLFKDWWAFLKIFIMYKSIFETKMVSMQIDNIKILIKISRRQNGVYVTETTN